MINIQLALILGCLLGGASGAVLFILWRRYLQQGKLAWNSAKVQTLVVVSLSLLASVIVIETYREPLVRQVRYRVEMPMSDSTAVSRTPQRRHVRMSMASSDLSWNLAYPVAQRYVLFTLGLFVLSFVVRRTWQLQPMKKMESESSKSRRYWPASIDRGKALQGLNQLMASDKVYRDPALSLSNLATKLGISRYYLSQLINEELGSSYYELINNYRCKEAQQLMIEEANKEITISSIGFEVGFNSKASFYRAFKEETGLSPAAYRKVHVKKS